jgi:hypothetical protein
LKPLIQAVEPSSFSRMATWPPPSRSNTITQPTFGAGNRWPQPAQESAHK